MKSTISIKSFAACLLVWIFLASCIPLSAASLAISNQPRIVDPQVPLQDFSSLVMDNNTFAFDLYQSLRNQAGNLAFSPYSISLALAMTFAGARGETEKQMAQVLNFNLDQGRLHPSFNSLDAQLNESPGKVEPDQEPLQLEIANSVWAEKTYPFLPEFLDLLASNYGAGVRLADFIGSPESTRRQINAWVKDQTHDRIQDLIPEGALSVMARMVLANAIYFKADWLFQFDKDSTHDASFHLLDGSVIEIPTMSQGIFNLPYMHSQGVQVIELAYAGDTAAMDILVPDEGTFSSFESALDQEKLGEFLAGLQETPVMLSLPKFSFTSAVNLSDQLIGMGMPDAFDPERADFTGMSNQRELFISDVLHEAFIAVDEEGTEAAAATAVIMEVTSAPMFEVSLNIDRPFIFLIRDLSSGQILFLGRVVDPRS